MFRCRVAPLVAHRCAGCSRQGSRGACSHSLRGGAGGRAALAMANCLWAHATDCAKQTRPRLPPSPDPPHPPALDPSFTWGRVRGDHHSHMSGKGPPARWTPARGRPPWPCPSPPPLREPAPPTTARGQLFRVGSPSASFLLASSCRASRGTRRLARKKEEGERTRKALGGAQRGGGGRRDAWGRTA
jgi:hypothetical protein